MAYFVLLVALGISGVAAWYSIIGLAAIFAAAKIPVIIMGASLEVGKLVTASWLYQNWERAPFLLKSYLTIAVVVLMFITSMGIFGFLSKAHMDQTIVSGDNTLLIEQLDQRISREQTRIRDAELVISQLDQSVQTLMNYDRIRGNDGAIAVREGQKDERNNLNAIIDSASNSVGDLRGQRLELSQEQLALEAEVGPIRYIAELVYDGDPTVDILGDAVRYVILIIIFVFDPLAVLLLIAANISIKDQKPKLTTKKVVSVNVDSEWVEEDVEFEEMPEDMDLTQVRSQLEKFRANPKSEREGTFIYNKVKKLERLEKQLLERE
tara:strand:+ start:1486 stop:2454 length:969 start_codon:yes stop_codon:yes gene_type:complete